MGNRIASPSETNMIIKKHDFSFKKGYGQNFLTDSNVLLNIAEAAAICKDDCVIEIGPGIGGLTQVLLERAGKVIAIEIDKKLIPILDETLMEYDNLEIINGDVLKLDLKKLIEEKCSGLNVKICANLPYYITTPIIMGILEQEVPISIMTVMVQKEVAERIKAGASTPSYGALSIAVGFYAEAMINFIVPAESFIPKPKVDSAVITLKLRKSAANEVIDKELFFRLVRASFGQRRKTLINTILNSPNFNLSREQMELILKDLGYDIRIRGEAIDIDGFVRISNSISNLNDISK